MRDGALKCENSLNAHKLFIEGTWHIEQRGECERGRRGKNGRGELFPESCNAYAASACATLQSCISWAAAVAFIHQSKWARVEQRQTESSLAIVWPMRGGEKEGVG